MFNIHKSHQFCNGFGMAWLRYHGPVLAGWFQYNEHCFYGTFNLLYPSEWSSEPTEVPKCYLWCLGCDLLNLLFWLAKISTWQRKISCRTFHFEPKNQRLRIFAHMPATLILKSCWFDSLWGGDNGHAVMMAGGITLLVIGVFGFLSVCIYAAYMMPVWSSGHWAYSLSRIVRDTLA